MTNLANIGKNILETFMKNRSLLSTMAVASVLALSGVAAHAGCGPKCKGKCTASGMSKCGSKQGKSCAAKAGQKCGAKDANKCASKCAPKCAGK
jgi:hypothetical protein